MISYHSYVNFCFNFRFYIVKNGFSDEQNATHVKIGLMLLVIGFIYNSSHTIITLFQEKQPLLNTCLHVKQLTSYDFKIAALVGTPYDLFTVTSLIMDIRTFVTIR